MQKTLFIKLSIIAGLCLIFAVGLSLLQSLVYERQHYADSVINEIANQHVRPQEVITPFIAYPTTFTPECQSREEKDCPPAYVYITPLLATQTQAEQDLQVSTDTYQRGIYHATSYQGTLTFTQEFILNTKTTATTEDNHDSLGSSTTSESETNSVLNTSNANTTNPTQTSGKPTPAYHRPQQRIEHRDESRLVIPVSDLRGVSNLPTVTINGTQLTARYPDTQSLSGLSYVEVEIPSNLLKLSKLNIKVDLPLVGISELHTIPLGQQFMLNMSSNWHAPNFIGQALPNQKNFDNTGFSASWQNQYLTIANNQSLTTCLSQPNQSCRIISLDGFSNNDVVVVEDIYTSETNSIVDNGRIHLNAFGVSFAEPNDVYLQTQRTMKYALLLILVSFGTFFLFEIIKSSRIHPIQYLLVGAALLVFYVLLLPLAEQVPFWQAYAIAAAACVSLIGWYSHYVLGNIKRALIFTVLLSSLYAAFYGILTTEDLNLLLGAIFCFIFLAAVMYLTRKIDWYKIA
ncbi:cell envelope integrity protein CreD [Psychrobacter sp. I-STPA10]|uniref:cell envelope integrity protein CreD n=1 Tax=Psychrobacter sp. I-STPA10 TaxID=2585769 RepID=UPI001E2A34E9|nr:cell envelope integrity protein CreD [Psychrobacter sp. I-STPA10]